MTDLRSHVVALNEVRARVWEEAKGFLDKIADEKREMDAEERAQWERYNTRIDEIDAEVRSFVETETREQEAAEIREAHASVFGAPPVQRGQSEAEQIRAWATGAGPKQLDVNLGLAHREAEMIRGGASPEEVRALLWDTGSAGSTVPTELSRQLYAHVTASVALMRMGTTKLFTDSGAPLEFPKVATHGIATQVIAQGTAIGGTDPTFDKMTLDAYKYGQIVQLSSEVVSDSGVDIIGFVAQNIGRAIGELVANPLVVGTGSNEPQGVVSAIVGAGTIGTGGSLIAPSYEKLVDLAYSVNGNYRARPGAAFLANDLTTAHVRKLRDGAGGTVGAVLWQPSLTQGIQGAEPDRLLGFPWWTDPNVASMASNAKILAFGDFSAYYIRQAGGVQLERSDDFAFSADLVTYRGKTRVDADVIDATALNVMKQSVS